MQVGRPIGVHRNASHLWQAGDDRQWTVEVSHTDTKCQRNDQLAVGQLTNSMLWVKTQAISYRTTAVASGGRKEYTQIMRATAYFCCSPGVSMLAKNNGIS